MTNKNIVCGVDVHKDFFVATLLLEEGKEVKEYKLDREDILEFKGWIEENSCESVAIESTGVYWVPIYVALEDNIKVIVANPQQVKQIPGRKTDESDSEWLAKLLKSDLIKPSYIPERDTRELRDLLRLRTKVIQTRTDFKNRIRKVLERANIRLASVLSDLFGKAGLKILEGLTSGKDIEEIVESIDKRIDKESVKEAIRGELSDNDIFVLERCISMIENLDEEIAEIEKRIAGLTKGMNKDLERIMSIPGVGKQTAQEVLAEISDVSRFPSAKHLASWAGLAPSVYQSGGKNLTGRTRKGSKWLRKTMYQVAQGASKSKSSKLRDFYLRIKAKKGYKVAIVALARKIICIIYHLLTKGECYTEEGVQKRIEKLPSLKTKEFEIRKAIHTLQKAGYTVSER